MVGLIIAILRGHTTEEIFDQVFTTERVNIPRAPGLGLVLEYVHYDRYNNRYGEDGMHEKLIWDECEKDVNEFKEDFIYPTIINTEVNEKSIITWLDKLFKHRYDANEDQLNEDEDGCDDDDDGGENKSNSNTVIGDDVSHDKTSTDVDSVNSEKKSAVQ